MERRKERDHLIARSEMDLEDIGKRTLDDRTVIFRILCHGDPSRSPWVFGRPFPLCWRCSAFYLSMLISTVLSPFLMIEHAPEALPMAVIFIMMMAPLVMDGMTQYLGKRQSNDLLRALTGSLAGSGSGMAVAYIVYRLFTG